MAIWLLMVTSWFRSAVSSPVSTPMAGKISYCITSHPCHFCLLKLLKLWNIYVYILSSQMHALSVPIIDEHHLVPLWCLCSSEAVYECRDLTYLLTYCFLKSELFQLHEGNTTALFFILLSLIEQNILISCVFGEML